MALITLSLVINCHRLLVLFRFDCKQDELTALTDTWSRIILTFDINSLKLKKPCPELELRECFNAIEEYEARTSHQELTSMAFSESTQYSLRPSMSLS